MAFNTLENTTSFSGADIKVVAYRGPKTPAERFDFDNQKRREKKAQLERDAAADEISKKETKLQNELIQTSGEIETIGKKQRQLLASGAPQDSTAWRSLEGKAQNKRSQFQKTQKKLNSLDYQRLDNAETELTNIQNETPANGSSLFILGTIHTVSYSSFREKFAVRALGVTQAKAYTRGPRTIAGTMVFNVVQEHELLKLMSNSSSGSLDPLDNNSTDHPSAVMIDQVQPFHLLFLFANELGAFSSMHLFNVDISSEGQEMSVDSIITHNAMNFYATDMVPMRTLGNAWDNETQMINGEIGQGLVGLSESSSALRVANQNNLNAKDKTDSINSLLSQSRGLF